jgi:hypothetical protein
LGVQLGTASKKGYAKNTMRQLTDHIVAGDSANHQLAVEALDAPGQGNACHLYGIFGFESGSNVSNPTGVSKANLEVLFQNGPIKTVGVNGITHEALLAILIDRLRGFQEGPYKSRENAIALTHLEEGLMWLQKRTSERIKRGVEGTHAL